MLICQYTKILNLCGLAISRSTRFKVTATSVRAACSRADAKTRRCVIPNEVVQQAQHVMPSLIRILLMKLSVTAETNANTVSL